MADNDGDNVDPNERAQHVLFQLPSTRRKILLAYWAVVVLALPLWYWTTSIQRLALPSNRVRTAASRQLNFSLNVDLDAHDVPFLETTQFARRVEEELNILLHQSGARDVYKPSVSLGGLSPGGYVVNLRNGEERVIEGRKLVYGVRGLTPLEVPKQLAQTLTSLFATRISHADEQHVMPFSPRYRLAFTLLNEDATEGPSPTSWDAREAIAHELSPTLLQLSTLHNFTIESQVQLYAPLEFEPVKLGNDTNLEGSGLTHDQLSVFVNSAEWTLSSSVSSDPVLHFVIFVPSVKHRPLRLLDIEGRPRKSTTFTIPQWGSIFIYNPPSNSSTFFHLNLPDLHVPFISFRSQLLSLLGVHSLPPDVTPSPTSPFLGGLTSWQLDAVLRRRAIENAKGTTEALMSILNLVSQIEGMPVGPGVRGDVDGALDSLEKTYSFADFPHVALSNSADAITRASRAFFNPDMLALLYFPPEHNLAVYTPLLAPIAVPLVAAVLREIVGLRKSRKITSDNVAAKAKSS